LSLWASRKLVSVAGYPAIFESHDPISVTGIYLGVRNLDYSRAFVIQNLEHVHNFFALGRMKISSWLIRQDDPWVCNYRTGDPYQLLLPA
jgi:hypothetical protein